LKFLLEEWARGVAVREYFRPMENQSAQESVYIPPWKDKHGREDYKGPGAAKQPTDKVLFSPFKLRDVTLKNRIVVSPM
jgi:hypothetical protein